MQVITVPYLIANPDVGFVQACWVFTNPTETLLTKVCTLSETCNMGMMMMQNGPVHNLQHNSSHYFVHTSAHQLLQKSDLMLQAQEISLNYHFLCEQYTHFASGAFFNFNGTAGVWRKKCIDNVGGWNARTTVEDMDLSLRAYLAGWQAVFLKDTQCLNEVRPTWLCMLGCRCQRRGRRVAYALSCPIPAHARQSCSCLLPLKLIGSSSIAGPVGPSRYGRRLELLYFNQSCQYGARLRSSSTHSVFKSASATGQTLASTASWCPCPSTRQRCNSSLCCNLCVQRHESDRTSSETW